MTMYIDLKNRKISLSSEDGPIDYSFSEPEAFEAISNAWLQVGWDQKHVYTFTWLGRPVIQLPEDMVRTQEVIYQIKPSLIIETGVAHGGSLVFYASLLRLMGRGRVIGVDIEIRPHNRKAIEEHELSSYITLIESDSIASATVNEVEKLIQPDDVVLVLLDSNHTYEHVLGELNAYSKFVTPGSYIVATDGIMEQVVGAPRTKPDWVTNNPKQAAIDFVAANPNFEISTPSFLFNESTISTPVTYWPSGWIKRKK